MKYLKISRLSHAHDRGLHYNVGTHPILLHIMVSIKRCKCPTRRSAYFTSNQDHNGPCEFQPKILSYNEKSNTSLHNTQLLGWIYCLIHAPLQLNSTIFTKVLETEFIQHSTSFTMAVIYGSRTCIGTYAGQWLHFH